MIKNLMYPLIAVSLILAVPTSIVFADNTDLKGTAHDLTIHANWAGALYDANQHFMKGDYNKSIKIYDDYSEYFPDDLNIKAMKAIALNNLRLGSTFAAQPSENISFPSSPVHLNKLSMIEFYEILRVEPHNIIALNGMGIGFGNYGEYEESKKYFKKTLDVKPDDKIAKNYLNYIEKIEKKYSHFHIPTEKPEFLIQLEKKEIPSWIKNNAGWWADGIISDKDFLSSIQYLIEKGIIKLDYYANTENLKVDQDREAWNFKLYLDKITERLKNEIVYIEHPNPSADVIKKFHNDSWKWSVPGLDNQNSFPDREVSLIDDVYHIKYKIYVSPQPASLPLNHVSTLENSFKYWEGRTFIASDDKKVIFHLEITERSDLGNVWVTWGVRNLDEGVLGHANIGKGIVEVALGSYGCDGSFQLFDIETVEKIMTHELGHTIGFGGHSDNPNDMMHGTMTPGFAYCLLD